MIEGQSELEKYQRWHELTFCDQQVRTGRGSNYTELDDRREFSFSLKKKKQPKVSWLHSHLQENQHPQYNSRDRVLFDIY